MAPAPPKSCSSCRFRKIKCDRREKLKAADASDDSEVKCSNCQASGTTCVFISAPPKQRLGKRIRALRDLDNSHDELLYGSSQANPAASSSGMTSFPRPNAVPQGQALVSRNDHSSTSSIPSTSSLPLDYWHPSASFTASNPTHGSSAVGQSLLRRGMFGVKGLTKQLLESCIAAYLFTASPVLPIIRPDSFIPRLKAFFQLYSGDLPESGVEPLDDLIVIASACAGASCLQSSGPEAVAGSERKFEILEDLRNAFLSLAESENGERLKRAGLDGVAGCYIMTVLQEDEKWTDNLLVKELKETPSLQISPISTEGVVRMGIAMGLHVRSQENDDAQSLTGRESEGPARNRIWWCILGNDAFRALAYRRPPYIVEHSFDHGGDSELGEDVYKSKKFQAMKALPGWVVFEYQWLSSMVTITFLARSILPGILSERAQRRGVEVDEVSRVIDSLQRWRSSLPREVTWEAQHQPGVHGSGEAVPERAFKCRIRAVYLECLFHFSVMGLTHGLEDAGFRQLNDRVKETATYLPSVTKQPISTASIRATSNHNPSSNSSSHSSPSESPAYDPRLIETLKKVDLLADSTFERLAHILPQAASEGMIRASSSVLRGAGTGAIILGTETVVRRAREGYDSSYLNKTLDQAQNLIASVATCDSSRNTPFIVKQMEEAVSKARKSVAEILSNRRDSSATLSSSSSSTSGSYPQGQGQGQDHENPQNPFNLSASAGKLDLSSDFSSGNYENISQTDHGSNRFPQAAADNRPNFFFNQTSPSSDPSSLFPTSDLGGNEPPEDQLPGWLADFVSANGNQEPIFEFSVVEDQWMNQNLE